MTVNSVLGSRAPALGGGGVRAAVWGEARPLEGGDHREGWVPVLLYCLSPRACVVPFAGVSGMQG